MLSDSPTSAQRSFMLAFTLTLNEKYYSEMLFKHDHKVLANSMICFTLCFYNVFQGREKHIDLHKKYSVRFLDRKLSWILRY